ncbi:MAG: SMC family ATPase [Microbacterium sp.]|uniref:AAA family ATPase n=1 Tax=Microbacterium TaxID=33882 RepID=UPI0025F00CD1|nr:SMC family ATPase [Microbacterium sp. UBA1097]
MRIHRVQIEGFGPFRERQDVDLDALAPSGVFVIAGRTGAGKSSILDAICFALYGTVPRYDGVDRRLRSDHCGPDDPTQVTLEFSTGSDRWRISRSPDYERPKRRGTGMTVVAADALLERLETDADGGERWVGYAAGPRDVGHAIDEVVGLSHQQFLQVILLAQNRFSQFLLAGNTDRQRVLRTLFGTQIYEDYEKRLDERRRESEREQERDTGHLQSLQSDIETLAREAGWLVPDETVDLERLAARAGYDLQTRADAVDRAEEALAAAEGEHTRVRQLREQQQQRNAAREHLAAIEIESERLGPDRVLLERARAAEPLRAAIEEAGRAHADVEATGKSEASILADAVAGVDTALTVDELFAAAQALTGDIARWQDAEDAEQQLAMYRADLNRATTQAEAVRAVLAVTRDALTVAEQERARLGDEIEKLSIAAAGLDAARAESEDLAMRLVAAREAETAAGELVDASADRLTASRAVEEAVAAWGQLMRRRLAGFAAELADGLTDDDPCPVCGSLDHPEPAPSNHDPVTDAVLAAAEEDRDRALAADRESAARHTAVTARVDAARARARGSVDELHARQRESQSRLELAERATEALDRARCLRGELEARENELRRELDEAAARLTELDTARTVLGGRITEAEEAVATARGPFPSVHARIADAEARRRMAQSLAEARRAHELALERVRDADRELDAGVAASSFPDAPSARAALLTPMQLEDLSSRLSDHDAAKRIAKERLLELELQLADAPDDLIDTDASLREATAARETWQRAVAELAAVRERVARFGDVRAAIERLNQDGEQRRERHRMLVRLADTLAGRAPNTMRMTLETFVLAAELEEIVAAANLRLADMSDGRYRLEHTDALARRGAASGLGLHVHDAYTGRSRPPQSLSGGETFLASLALALGLAEVVTSRAGGIRLDTLFIDEGFGSLDAETLELALRTLDDLRSGGRTIGVISHVEAMKEQLPIGILVEASPHGSRVITEAAPSLL